MDSKNRWHMTGYQGHGEDKTIIDRIMHRFRPIAPKPVTGGSFSGNVSLDSRNLVSTRKRVKRKYVRVKKKNNPRSRDRSCEDEHKGGLESSVVTLQLLPENADFKNSLESRSWCNFQFMEEKTPFEDNRDPLKLINTEISFMRKDETGKGSDRTPVVGWRPSMVVESWVTVECVTSTCCMEVIVVPRLIGCTDVEKKNNLEGDTCPGFISDCFGKVGWVNAAYKRMAVREEVNDDCDCDGVYMPELIVWLKTKSKFPNTTAFSCLVRIENLKNKKEKWSKMVPCDVWRMDFGGLAWRLDMKAALGLAL